MAEVAKIVGQLSFRDSVSVQLFYNPTFKEQQKQWNSQDRVCFAVAWRMLDIWEPIMALQQAADCRQQQLVRKVYEQDIVESIADMANILYGSQWGIPSAIVNQLADSVPALIGGGRSLIFVAHSQGNLIVDRALRLVPNPPVLNAPPSRCVALLSLATPLDPQNFLLGAEYRRHLTVKHDILRQLFMDYPSAFELETPLSQELDQLLLQVPPESQQWYRSAWGVKVHNAVENYLKPASSVLVVKNRLTQLRQKCTTGQ